MSIPVLNADEWATIRELAFSERTVTTTGWTRVSDIERMGSFTWRRSGRETRVTITGWTAEEDAEAEQVRLADVRRQERLRKMQLSQYPKWPEDENRYLDIAKAEADRLGITILRWRTGLTGMAITIGGRKEIEVCQPRGRKSLFVFLHECGHIVLEHQYGKGKPRYLVEYEAEIWAIDRMRELRIPIHRDSIARARRYVAEKIRRAKRRGAKRIDSRVAGFALRR